MCRVPRLQRKSLASPDLVRSFPFGHVDVVNLDETSVARCVPDGFDDLDGDAATYQYAWLVNGVDAGIAWMRVPGCSGRKVLRIKIGRFRSTAVEIVLG